MKSEIFRRYTGFTVKNGGIFMKKNEVSTMSIVTMIMLVISIALTVINLLAMLKNNRRSEPELEVDDDWDFSIDDDEDSDAYDDVLSI